MRDEATLLQRARQGETRAFDELFEPYLPRAYRTAYLITHNPESAADSLQEALLRAHRALHKVQPDRPFYPWFARIVTNEAIKQAQRQGKVVSLPLPEMLVAPAVTPEIAVVDHEERERLWQLIQQLSPNHRAVVVLRYYEDLSEAEIAATLGVSPGTVKSRLHYARAALSRRLRATDWLSSLLTRIRSDGGVSHG